MDLRETAKELSKEHRKDIIVRRIKEMNSLEAAYTAAYMMREMTDDDGYDFLSFLKQAALSGV